MTIQQHRPVPWTGHARGTAPYGRLLAALFCAGVATFAQLYSPQAVLPLISADLQTGAAAAALMVSASTVGLALGVIPWSVLADRVGRVKAISLFTVDTSDFGVLDFDLTDKDKAALYGAGERAGAEFLTTWNWPDYLARFR